VSQLWLIEIFSTNLKKKVYSNKNGPKDVKYFMAKIKTELKSIETTEIRRKAMNEVPVKAFLCKYYV
jgi:hypothetical protein